MDMLLAAAESLRVAEMNEIRMRTGKIQKLHVKRKRGVFKCDQCSSVFGLRHNLLRHKRTIHEGRRPFKCNAAGCNASFVQRFDLQTHGASVHQKRKDFSCRVCLRAFSQRSNLLTHLRSAHEGIDSNDIQQMLDESPTSSTCSTASTPHNNGSQSDGVDDHISADKLDCLLQEQQQDNDETIDIDDVPVAQLGLNKRAKGGGSMPQLHKQ